MKIDVNKLTIGEAKTKLKEYEELAKALGETPKRAHETSRRKLVERTTQH